MAYKYITPYGGTTPTPQGSQVSGSQYDYIQPYVAPVKKETTIVQKTEEQPKQKERGLFSLFHQISDLVAKKLNSITPGGTKAGIERLKKKPLKEFFLPTATGGKPFRQYVGRTAISAVNSVKGAGKLTPAYMMYKAVTGKPVTAKEYWNNLKEFGGSVFDVAWRTIPEAPIIGTGFGAWTAVRKYAQKKISAEEMPQYLEKGLVEQPYVGQAITDNVKLAQAINFVFMGTMFLKPVGQKKFNEMNLKASEVSRASDTLGVKPTSSMEEVSKALRKEIKKIPDAFTSDPSSSSLVRRKELTDAFNLLKESGAFTKRWAKSFEFLLDKTKVEGEILPREKLPAKTGVKVEPVIEKKPPVKPTTPVITKVTPEVEKISSVSQENLKYPQKRYFRGLQGKAVETFKKTGVLPKSEQAFGGKFSITDDFDLAKGYAGEKGIVVEVTPSKNVGFSQAKPKEGVVNDITDIGEGEYLVASDGLVKPIRIFEIKKEKPKIKIKPTSKGGVFKTANEFIVKQSRTKTPREINKMVGSANTKYVDIDRVEEYMYRNNLIDKTIYHGTPKNIDINELSADFTGTNLGGKKSAKAIYFSNKYKIAQDYSVYRKNISGEKGTTPKIIEAKLNNANLKIINSNEFITEKRAKEIRDQGYDGILKKGIRGSEGFDEYLIFNPKVLISQQPTIKIKPTIPKELEQPIKEAKEKGLSTEEFVKKQQTSFEWWRFWKGSDRIKKEGGKQVLYKEAPLLSPKDVVATVRGKPKLEVDSPIIPITRYEADKLRGLFVEPSKGTGRVAVGRLSIRPEGEQTGVEGYFLYDLPLKKPFKYAPTLQTIQTPKKEAVEVFNAIRADRNNRVFRQEKALQKGLSDFQLHINRSELTQIYNQAVKAKKPKIKLPKKAPKKQVQKSISPKKKVLAPTRARKTKEVLKEVNKVGYLGFLNKDKTGYLRPKLGKIEFKTIMKASKEFRENPVLTVDKNKDLVFKSKKTSFKIHPLQGMGIKPENLKVGDKIIVDENALKKAGRGINQLRVYYQGKAYASVGKYAHLRNLTKLAEKENLKVIEFPEMVRIAEDLMGKVPTVTASRRGRYLGAFRPKQFDIVLKSKIFKNPADASRVLSHELGHLADYLPQKTMSRGNLIGRIASLRKNLQRQFGNLNDKVLREELLNLSAKWRPYYKQAIRVNEETGAKELVEIPIKTTGKDLVGNKYRASSKELYADAISVLFNDPLRLKHEAPKFNEGFFKYLDRKPAVKENFEKIWDLLNQGEEEIFKKRDEYLNKSFEKGEEAFASKYLDKQKRKTSLMYHIKLLFDDKNTPIKEKIRILKKQGKTVPAKLNPDYALKGLLYSDGELKNYVNDNFQPAYSKAQEIPNGWNELGKILFYERVINERGELANPQGYNPSTATKQLEMTKKKFSKDDWAKLQESKTMFRKAVEKSVKEAKTNKYYSPELLKQMKANPAYATYQVVDYLDTYITSHVYKQTGTLKDIANPATSTVMKLVSLHKAIQRNNAKKLNMSFLAKDFPESIQKAKTRWNGRSMEVTEPKDPNLGLVITIDDGKPQGYYVEKDIANMLNYTSNTTLRATARVARAISQSGFYRPIFTTFNLGFQTFNFVRDITRTWKNYPHLKLREVPLSPIIDAYKIAKRYGKAIKPAHRRVANKPSVVIKEMENLNILGLTYNDIYGRGIDTEAKQIERVFEKAGIIPRPRRAKLLRPFSWVLDKIGDLGDFVETLPKVAGYVELKGSMPEAELAEYVRTAIGSPAFRVGGTVTPVSNNIYLFSNAIKEGIKTDIQVGTGKKGKATGASFWWKTILREFLPKVIMAGIAGGYFGKKLQKNMNDASEYDKTNYTIIPIGFDENGKAIYLRIPTDETGRFLGGIFWKMINLNKDKTLTKDIFQIFSFGAGQFPNLSPTFTGAGALVTYLSGKNPYDSYRGRNIIPDTEFKAGTKYSFPILLKWLVKNQGLGIFFPTYKPEYPTDLEKLLSAPILSNILSRWIRVSDYGQREKNRKITGEVETKTAQESLRKRKIIDDALKEYRSNPSLRLKSTLKKKIVEETLGHARPKNSDEKRIRNATIKKFEIGIIRGESDSSMNSLIDAYTNDQKVELLKSFKKSMNKIEYNNLVKEAKKYKIISNTVLKRIRKISSLFKVKNALAFNGSSRQVEIYNKLKSSYTKGEASFYHPMNPAETRKGTTGVGAYNRKVKSGSVAFGNRVFHDRLKAGEKIYIKVKGFEDIKTPYGNGVFRIDDTMNIRYNRKGHFNIDFNSEDLGKKRQRRGRFPIEFKIVEPGKKEELPKYPRKRYYA